MNKRSMHTELTETIITHLYNLTKPVSMLEFPSFEFLKARQQEAIKHYQNDAKFHTQVKILLSEVMFVVDRHTDNYVNQKKIKECCDSPLIDFGITNPCGVCKNCGNPVEFD